MDDPLLMGVLHRLADLDESCEPFAGLSRRSSQYFVMAMPLTSSMTK